VIVNFVSRYSSSGGIGYVSLAVVKSQDATSFADIINSEGNVRKNFSAMLSFLFLDLKTF
jgi:hypothetical protein